MTREFWVSVTCTDRAASLRELATDLVAQAAAAELTLVLLVHDNCARAAERRAVDELVVELRRTGTSVDVAATTAGGGSIAASRRHQREQIRDQLARGRRPAFIWMLDDDMRLDHLYWADAVICRGPLHRHVSFLHELGRARPDLAVLIGEACGDAPIPVIGSVAGRLIDLEENLRNMFESAPEAPWVADASVRARLLEPDAYYDLSLAASPARWRVAVPWVPRGRRVNTAEALQQMLEEVEHIPRGSGFSRPILAEPNRFSALAPRPVRGGNSVFFDVDQCLRHPYPSRVLAGIETRRSDMIGTTRLEAQGVAVMGSGFSVLHHRDRASTWPGRHDLEVALIADTMGAAMARIDASDLAALPCDASEFVAARLARISDVAREVAQVVFRLRNIVTAAPAWTPSLDAVLAVADWALATFPGAREGTLPREVAAWMTASVTQRHEVMTTTPGSGGGAA